eukprot:TRINITY_DN7609_c0_g1_i1.p1 TRINITY_DN7609_c0_g1~~TRINITY_DN7609_c0_g1_i1.p1  ORF type:complete len:218 (-),score=43.26 TRINITY_DN7609_c0_g1_i1:606-1259(-)
MSRWQSIFKNGRALSIRASQRKNDQDLSASWGAVAAGVSVAALGYKIFSEKERYLIQAKGLDVTPEQKSFDNRIRQYNTPDMVFNYFASLQLVNESGMKTTMMSPMDFFSAITPDCSIHPGAGSGVYEEISQQKLKTLRLDKSPVQGSILNEIGRNGLISYADYCFLLSLLSTPIRFVDTAFNLFDLTGNEQIMPRNLPMSALKSLQSLRVWNLHRC